jgi:hypothetical protein
MLRSWRSAPLCVTFSSCHARLIAWEVPYGYVPSLIAIVLGAALFATRHSSFGVLVENQLWLCSIQLALTVPVVCLAISRTIRRS